MNPSITISVDLNNKAANALSGMVTVGAKVDVKVTGISADSVPAWAGTDDFTGKSLRFRVVDAIGRDLVRFPLVKKTDGSNGDAWSVSGDEFTATGVEFDTAQLRDAMAGIPYDAKMEFGVILDSVVDDAQYAVGRLKVRQWAACPTDDPTVLPDWRETLVRIDNGLSQIEEKKTAAETAATTAEDKATEAGNSATAANGSAGAAATSAALANEYANGNQAGTVKGAKQYAADAEASASAAEGSATDLAQAVADAQEAQGKAEDAQTAAEAAVTNASAVLSSAVKTTAQTLEDGEKSQARTNIGAASESSLSAHTGNSGIHVTSDEKNAWSAKQAALVSGTNIKTVNGTSILGAGNISVGGDVSSVNGKTGEVVLTAADIDLVPGTTVQNSVMTHHTNYRNPHEVTAEQVGARPNTWMPSAADVGALTQTTADGRYVQTSDSRLTDARTPTAHKSTHATGGADALTAADIGALAASDNGSTISHSTGPGGPAIVTSSLYSSGVYGDGIYAVTDDEAGPLADIGQYGGNFKNARQEVNDIVSATADSVRGLAAYPIASVVGGALKDRTINTSSGGTFTLPTRTGTNARDFVLSVEASATAPTVSFPATVSYVSDDSSVWTTEAGKTNVWYFSEVIEDVFMVAHKALDSVSQS